MSNIFLFQPLIWLWVWHHWLDKSNNLLTSLWVLGSCDQHFSTIFLDILHYWIITLYSQLSDDENNPKLT